jgi:hypothetical protein
VVVLFIGVFVYAIITAKPYPEEWEKEEEELFCEQLEEYKKKKGLN